MPIIAGQIYKIIRGPGSKQKEKIKISAKISSSKWMLNSKYHDGDFETDVSYIRTKIENGDWVLVKTRKSYKKREKNVIPPPMNKLSKVE